MNLEFVLDIVPIPKGRPRLGRFSTYTPERTREYENALKREFNKYAPKIIFETPLRLYVEFVLIRPKKPKFLKWPGVKPDVDNFLKAVLDAGNDILWVDDSLICDIRVIKTYGIKSGIIVKVEEI